MPRVATLTKDMTMQQWLEFRRKNGIGGSDAPAIWGVSDFKTPWTVYKEKIGDYVNDSTSEAAKMGIYLEDIVAKIFSERTGKKVWNTKKCYQHSQYPFMIADIDRLVVGEKTFLECKTTSLRNEDKWAEGRIPKPYWVQVQHYLAVMDAPYCYIAVLIGGQHFLHKVVERDDEFIERLIKAEKKFWDCVQKRQPPSIDGSENTKQILDILFPPEKVKEEIIELPSEAKQLIIEQEQLKAQIKDLEEAKKERENKLREILGENTKGVYEDDSGLYEVHWTPVSFNDLDKKAVKEKYPKIYNKCLMEVSYRRLSVKRREKE